MATPTNLEQMNRGSSYLLSSKTLPEAATDRYSMNFKMLQFEKILKRNKLAKSLENT